MDGIPTRRHLTGHGERLDELVTLLTSGEHGLVAVLPGHDGVEGFGTTALAAAACRHPEVREHFTGGVAWVSVGTDRPGHVRLLVAERVAALDVDDDADPDLLDVLLDVPGDGLVVLDGVRTADQLTEGVLPALNATVLVTARTRAVLPGSPPIIRLPPLDGGWPLLVALADALHTTPGDSFDLADPVARTAAVRAVLEAGLPGLPDLTTRDRLIELGVFGGDGDIPASLVRRVWRETAGLPDEDGERLMAELSRLGLVDRRTDRDLLLVPDAIRACLRESVSPEVAARAGRFLVAGFPGDYAGGTAEASEYCLAHLPDHQVAAGGPLADLVGRVEWVTAKLFSAGVAAAERDLAGAGSPETERLRRALAQNAHVLKREDGFDGLLPTLLGRLHDLGPFADSLREMLHSFAEPWLECLWAPPDLAHPAIVRTIQASTEDVVAVAIAPDVTWIATASWDGTARIWDLGGTLRVTLDGHDDKVTDVAISPDGTWLATASWDETVRTWLADGTPLAVLEGALAKVNHVTIAPDGTWIAAMAEDGTLLAWSDHGGPLWRAQAQAARYDPVVIGADSSFLAHLTEDEDVCVWNRDGTLRATIPHEEGTSVLVLAAHPRRDLIVTVHEDSRVCVWSPEGVPHTVTETDLEIYSTFSISPDGVWMAGEAANPDGIVVARLDRPSESRFVAHPPVLAGLAVGSDSRRLVTAKEPDIVQIWDLDRFPPREKALRRPTLNAVTIAPDGAWLATAGDGLTLRDTGDGSATILDEEPWYTSVAISPSGRWLAGGSADGLVRLFDRDGTPIRTLRACEKWTRTVAISPDGAWLAAGGDGDRVRLWRADGGPLTAMRSPADAVDHIAIAPDGTWLATGGFTKVQLWDVGGRRLASTLNAGGLIGGLAMARDSGWVAVAIRDGGITLWERTGGHVKTLPGDARYSGLAVSRDSGYLAACAKDGTLHVWDVAAEELIATIRMDGGLNGCAWAPHGPALYVAGDAGLYCLALRVPR